MDLKDRGFYMKPYQNPIRPLVVATSRAPGRFGSPAKGLDTDGSSLLAPISRIIGAWWKQAAGAGRAADRQQWRIGRDIFVAETSVLARERARVLGRNYVRHQYPNRYGSSQMAATKSTRVCPTRLDVDYMMEHMWIVGDPQECADRIRQLYETVGICMLLAITQDSDNPEWDQRSLQLLMEEVGPRVADLGRG